MTRYIQKKLLLFGAFLLFALLIEAINFSLLDFGIFPDHYFMDLAFLFLIGSLFLLIPSIIAQSVIQIIFLLLMMIISFVNTNLQNITGEVFTWDMIVLIADANDALQGTNILDFSCNYIYAPLLLIVIVVLILIDKVFPSTQEKELPSRRKRFSKRNLLLTVIVSLSSIICGMILKEISYQKMLQSIDQNLPEEEKYLTDAYLFETLFQGDTSIQKFGAVSYYVKSVSYYLGMKGDTELSVSILDEFFSKSSPITNDYTGISSGNNVILILLESVEYFAIDPELTPTLYKMFYTDGIFISEYYAKQKTDYAEASSMFGSVPAHGSLFYNNAHTDFSFNLPNRLKANYDQIQLRSFHANEGTFYNRTNAHRWFGFDEHIDILKSNVEQTDFWINSDHAFFQDQLEEMIPSDGTPFFTYITSFTTHGGYEYRKSLEEGYAELEERDYQQQKTSLAQYKRTYMAAAMDFDKAMELLLERLESLDILDDTTILMYSDHYAYYYSFCWRIKGIDVSVSEYPELYHLPACIYDTKLKAKMAENGITQIDKFAITFDLTPTLLNLLGISYNPSWYIGYDLFSPDESIIVSKLGGIFNNKFYTNDGENILWQADDVTDQDWSDFQNNLAKVLEKTNYTNLMYEVDYFQTKPIEE